MSSPRAILLVFATAILFAPQDGFRAEQEKPESTPSLTELQTPNEAEKKQIRDLIDQIAAVERSMATMKDDLEVLNRVKDNQTTIYLTAEYAGEPGNRDRRYFVNENVTIEWEGEQPARFIFFRRQARIRGVYVIKKTIKADSMQEGSRNDSLSVPVQILVEETLDSGKGQVTEFRIPSGDEASIQDHKELVTTSTGADKEARVIYLRQVKDRLKVLRSQLQLMRRAERMMRYLIRSKLKEDHNRYERTNTLP